MVKLLWVLGAVAAAVIGAYAAFEILFTSGLDGGGSSGLAKALVVLSALLTIGLTATYGRVFRDTWPD